MTVISTTPSAYAKEGYGAYNAWAASSNLRLISGAANSSTGDINLRAYVLGTGQAVFEWDAYSTDINPSTGQPYNTLVIELDIYDSSASPPTGKLWNTINYAGGGSDRELDANSTNYITEVTDTDSDFFTNRSVADPLGGFVKPFTAYIILYQAQDGIVAASNPVWSTGVLDFTLTSDIDLGFVDTSAGKSAFSYAGSSWNTGSGSGIYAAKAFANYALNVPQGARIVSAKLKTTAAGGSAPITSPQKIVTFAENADDSAEPTSTTRELLGDYIDALAKTSETEIEKAGWGAGLPVELDCTAAVQDVINRGGWVPNNGITIFTEVRPTIGTNLSPARNSDDEIDTVDDLSVYIGFTNYFQNKPELEVTYGTGAVGSSNGTSTVNGIINNAIAAKASGFSTAAAFAAPGVNITGSAAGSSAADAIGGSGINGIASASASSTASGASGEGREADSSGTSTASATSGSGITTDGSASGTSTASATSGSGISADGSASGASTASAIGSINFLAEGEANGVASAAASSRLLNSQEGSAAGTSSAQSLSRSENRATASSSGSSVTTGIGETGLEGTASAAGISIVTGLAKADSKAQGSSEGLATSSAQGASENRQEGIAAGFTTVLGMGAAEARAIFESLSFSTAEARAPTVQEIFFKDLSTRVLVTGIKNQTSRFIELDGGTIIEPTAFEPDASTYRDTHYYNAKTNTLYIKIIARKEPGIVVAHWQKVSQ